MRRLVRLLVVMSGLLMAVGCARTTPIRYGLSGAMVRPQPIAKRLVIDVFADERPASERVAQKAKLTDRLYTSDKDFKPEVSRQVAESLATHLKKAGLFSDVTVRDLPDTLGQDATVASTLGQEGFNLALTGALTHFGGSQSAPNPAGMAFGLIGMLTEAMTNPKSVRGHAEYRDLTLMNLDNQQVVWRETIGHELDRTDVFYDGPTAYAIEALKETHGKIANKIDDSL